MAAGWSIRNAGVEELVRPRLQSLRSSHGGSGSRTTSRSQRVAEGWPLYESVGFHPNPMALCGPVPCRVLESFGPCEVPHGWNS